MRYLKKKLENLKRKYGKDVHITDEAEEIVPNCELSEEKIMLDSFTQTDWASPVQMILGHEEKVLATETDLERVKAAVDILCKIIGFKDLEEVMGEQPEMMDRIE